MQRQMFCRVWRGILTLTLGPAEARPKGAWLASPAHEQKSDRLIRLASWFVLAHASIIVPGHGSLGQAEIARALLVYFTDVQERVRKVASGENIDAAVAALKSQIKNTYSIWEHDRFIEPAVRYFAQA
jgi:hypothetical protein